MFNRAAGSASGLLSVVFPKYREGDLNPHELALSGF